ncbi:MAG TPA: ubiquinol oxidase subunit II [Bacillales bacterium]|nr:ubiquinol oxidase subunit II [Bacillales bacterium]
MKNIWRMSLPITLLSLVLLSGCDERFPVLHPAGPVGKEELHLIILSVILVSVVIIPVFGLLAFILIRYRDKPGNEAPYRPNWSESKWLEIVWWSIPVVIVVILGTFTVKSTFSLTKPPSNNGEPMTVEVMSLDWKWLFLYPEQGVATVNYVNIPAGRPIQFILSSDAPMNSFWVPALGGQEYTMPGMAMSLWLQGNEIGTYVGKGANFTGKGFSHMHFKVHVLAEGEFEKWAQQLKNKSPVLTKTGYEKLSQPSVIGTKSFSAFPVNLYKNIVMRDGGKYMHSGMVMDKIQQEGSGE